MQQAGLHGAHPHDPGPVPPASKGDHLAKGVWEGASRAGKGDHIRAAVVLVY